MSVKSFQELPFEALFKMAEQKYQSLDYDEAQYFYRLAYQKRPHDEMLIMCLANLLKTNQKQDQAISILQKDIKTNPTGTYKRYFQLADIYGGLQAIQTFEKGIKEAIKCLSNPFKSTAPEGQIRRDIAQAYAGIAEVCMSDLIQQPSAQAKCTWAMQEGLKMDKTCIDIKLQIANYLMFKDDFQKARVQLLELHSWIMQNRQQYQSETINTTGKYLIEVQEYKKSLELYQKLYEDVSTQSEILYMLAYNCFKLGMMQQCQHYLEEYEGAKQPSQLVNQEIEGAVKEMWAQLNKKGKVHEETGQGQQQDQWMDVEEDDDM